MSAEAFALANLVIWVALLTGFGIREFKSLTSFDGRHRGIRYRRMSTADAMATIRRRERAGSRRQRSKEG